MGGLLQAWSQRPIFIYGLVIFCLILSLSRHRVKYPRRKRNAHAFAFREAESRDGGIMKLGGQEETLADAR